MLALLAYCLLFLPLLGWVILFGGYGRPFFMKPLFFVLLISPVALLSLLLLRRGWPVWTWLGELCVAAVLSAVLLTWSTAVAPAPSTHELSAQLDSVGVPAGWALVDERSSEGTPMCFDTCPAACRDYQVPGSTQAAIDSLRARFDQGGFRTIRDESTTSLVLVGRGPRSRLELTVQRRDAPSDRATSASLVQVCLFGQTS